MTEYGPWAHPYMSCEDIDKHIPDAGTYAVTALVNVVRALGPNPLKTAPHRVLYKCWGCSVEWRSDSPRSNCFSCGRFGSKCVSYKWGYTYGTA